MRGASLEGPRHPERKTEDAHHIGERNNLTKGKEKYQIHATNWPVSGIGGRGEGKSLMPLGSYIFNGKETHITVTDNRGRSGRSDPESIKQNYRSAQKKEKRKGEWARAISRRQEESGRNSSLFLSWKRERRQETGKGGSLGKKNKKKK